jgi:hypothetical protein
VPAPERLTAQPNEHGRLHTDHAGHEPHLTLVVRLVLNHEIREGGHGHLATAEGLDRAGELLGREGRQQVLRAGRARPSRSRAESKSGLGCTGPGAAPPTNAPSRSADPAR